MVSGPSFVGTTLKVCLARTPLLPTASTFLVPANCPLMNCHPMPSRETIITVSLFACFASLEEMPLKMQKKTKQITGQILVGVPIFILLKRVERLAFSEPEFVT